MNRINSLLMRQSRHILQPGVPRKNNATIPYSHIYHIDKEEPNFRQSVDCAVSPNALRAFFELRKIFKLGKV